MSKFTAQLLSASKAFAFAITSLTLISSTSYGLDFDWHGQFRAETNWLFGYSHGNLAPVPPSLPSTLPDSGYTIPSVGDNPASFQNLFFRLDPRMIVNDNISLHSDLWLGTPDRGIFGGDQNITSYYGTTRTGTATVSANTFYAEVATDFGTITVGRAPLNWGLGVVWNTTDGFDRFPSTGDVIRLETKLGAFRFAPGVVKYRNGSNYGGSIGNPNNICTTGLVNGVSIPCGTVGGGSGVSDYTVALMYANDDEQLDLGIMFMRRIAGMNSQVVNPFSVNTYSYTGYAYNLWDFYAKKKAGIFTFAAEVPLVSGFVNSKDYSTVAGAVKVDAQVTDHWTIKLNAGTADGQANDSAAAPAGKLTAFSFHPDYRPGLIMFNYNLRNLSNGAASPYYNPITNARFLSLAFLFASGKWTHEVTGLYAMADKTAGSSGRYFNTWDGIYKDVNAGATAQDKGLGFELDYELGYNWDESIRLGVNLGLLFPGKFYEFSNSATPNQNKTAFASGLNMLVKF